jgi:hypothetical protein
MHFNLLKAYKVPREILAYPDFTLRTSYEPENCDETPLPGQFFRLDEYSIFEWETGFSQDLDKDTAWSRLSRHAFIIPGTLLGYRDNCAQQWAATDEPCQWLTTSNWLRTVYAGMLQHVLAA